MSRKRELVDLILANLNRELESITRSAQAAHEAATHEESKAEDQHDTRGLEASYLAGAQMARIEALKKTIASYQFAEFREFRSDEGIGLGALVEVETNGKRSRYLLVGQGGGISVTQGGESIQVITPQAPLGEALMGRRKGDAVEVEGQKQIREYEIIQVE